jgi:hypothetical protein
MWKSDLQLWKALDDGGGDNMDVNRAWESIRENIKASSTESLGYY